MIVKRINEKKLLKQYVFEVVSMGPAYEKKELVKQSIEGMLVPLIKHGVIKDQEDLSEWWHTIQVDRNDLRSISFEAVMSNPRVESYLMSSEIVGKLLLDARDSMKNPTDLAEWWSSFDTAVMALKMVGIETWQKIATPATSA